MHLDEYRKLADVEDRMWYFRALNRRVSYWLARLQPEVEGRAPRILDAGCGTGGLLNVLRAAKPGWHFDGLDFSTRACELARERTGLDIVEGSITELPYENETFDSMISADVFCQVEDDALALSEFARVTKSGGVLIVNVPAYAWLWSYHDETCETRHRYTRGAVVSRLRTAGFEPLVATYTNLLPLPLIAARRKLFRPEVPTSDVKLYPPLIEVMFNVMTDLEFGWQRSGLNSPFGSSVFVAARKQGG